MGMISDILVNAKAKMQFASDKANDLCDVSKLKLLRKRIKSDVYKNYTALGRKYYAMSKKGEIDTADFSQELETIEDLHQQYENITQQIEDFKTKKRCAVCGCVQDADNTECEQCNSEM